MKFLRFKTLTILTLLLGAIPVLAQNETKKNDLVEAIKNQNASKPLINATISPNGEINFIPSGTGYIFVPPQLDNIKFSLPDGGPTPGSYSHQLLFNQWTDLDASDETIFNNENEEDVTTFDMGNLACTEVSEDSLSKAAQDLNWTSCYEGRLSWTRSKTSEKDLLKSDQNVCGCLKGFTKVPGVAEIMSKNVSIKRSRNVAQAELNDILNGFLFQTYALTGDTKVTTKYSNNLYGNKNGQDPTGEKLIYDANTQLVNDKVPFPPNQCLSPRVFLLTKQLPNSNIKMDLKKPFSEENWNYKLLEKRYFELMSLPVAEREEKAMNEIIHLKEKLKFLNRNPVIKYSFAVDISNAEKPEEAKKLKAYVFNQLQTLIPDACSDINSKCYHDYKNKMAELIKDPRLIPALRKEARLDHAERLKRKINSSVSEVRKEPTQRGIISEFMEQYRLPSPDTCEKDTTKGIECLEIYSGYCRTLDKYADDIDSLVNTQKISLVYNDLDELMKDDFNPDINTNEDFRMLNDTFCNKPVKRKFTARGYPETATFSQFVNIYCKQKSIPGCARNTNEDYSILREAWGEKYVTDKAISQVKSSLTQEEKHRVESIFNGKVNQMSMSDIQDMKVQTNRNQSDADLASEIPAITKSNIFDRPLSQVMASAHDGADSKSHLASLGQTVANNVAAFNESSPVFDELPVGYANNFSAPMQTAVTSSEIPKVEEMSDEKRRELLSDWQKEYGDWQKEKGDSLSQADKSKDNELRQEIATLKALLDQQKQISEQQYKLLNDAIIAKKEAISQIASAPQEEKISERKSTQSFAAAARAVQEDSGEASRAPASIKEVKHNTSGAMSGAATSTSVSKRNSSSSDGSSDSVAREEAKLVNMRRYSDGSITIEASGKSGNFQGNAITLPVSDEQYRLLQANPSSLNLSQIERNIPKDQIAKLEKSGEIIIFLQNGTNPPFEVKVARKDNRLVYSLKDKEGRDQAPVRRVFTREALAHELKARN